MKSTPSVFQLVVMIVFIFLGILGVVVFAGFGGLNSKKTPSATVWGTIPETQFTELVREINAGDTVIKVDYKQIAAEKFQDTFINALAEGKGPDVVLLSDDLVYSQQGKLTTIPYTSYDQRTYSDTYLNAAEHLLTPEGIIGFPFTVDPVVMYYNRGMLATAGVSEPPKTWAELQTAVPKIVKLNETKGVVKAAVALGEARNVNNAKEILVSMLMQAGNQITVYSPETGTTRSVIDAPGIKIKNPGVSVIDFYTAFSNPVNPLYTWNRSMPNSKQAFLAGDLAMYFGYASEYNSIRLENPNLDFDVAQIPQNSTDNTVTYGKVTALAIVKRSTNQQGAFDVINKLTEQKSQQFWVDISKLPPVRKDMLGNVVADKYVATFYRAAIQTKTWSDPDPSFSSTIFKDMIESVTTGLVPASQAITNARQRLELLLQGIKS
jgi:multiple sugar transport system substrate-binding protein